MAEKIHSADDVTAFLEELKTQTDRGAAVIAAAVLDEILQMLLVARFIEIGSERKDAIFTKIGAPLSSFSAKIELAFALGIMSNEARLACHLIRDIRNKFAHRIEPLLFDHPEVAGIIDSRVLPSVKTAVLARREQFLMSFQAIMVVLYATLAADIRVKSLEETHQEHFLKVAMEMHKITGRVPGPATPSPPPSPSESSTPE
jgi:hypothetical protein